MLKDPRHNTKFCVVEQDHDRINLIYRLLLAVLTHSRVDYPVIVVDHFDYRLERKY